MCQMKMQFNCKMVDVLKLKKQFKCKMAVSYENVIKCNLSNVSNENKV